MVDHEFDIFINKDAKILILGSFPSVKSRQEKFYYMHKSNRFYQVLSKIFLDDDFISPNLKIKKGALKRHKIALYDVIKSCEISLSDDNSIKKETPIDLENILKNYKITTIAINGNKAKELFKKYFALTNINIYFLPSTSARNANYSLEKLVEKWKIIKTI